LPGDDDVDYQLSEQTILGIAASRCVREAILDGK
jgi:hypothetical protein